VEHSYSTRLTTEYFDNSYGRGQLASPGVRLHRQASCVRWLRRIAKKGNLRSLISRCLRSVKNRAGNNRIKGFKTSHFREAKTALVDPITAGSEGMSSVPKVGCRRRYTVSPIEDGLSTGLHANLGSIGPIRSHQLVEQPFQLLQTQIRQVLGVRLRRGRYST
jgi:hypothetical protein